MPLIYQESLRYDYCRVIFIFMDNTKKVIIVLALISGAGVTLSMQNNMQSSLFRTNKWSQKQDISNISIIPTCKSIYL